MSSLAIVMMIAICGVVWGGFAVLLALALSRETKRSAGDGAAGRSREP